MQTKRGAEQYEREVRRQLVSGQWEESKKQHTPTLEEFAPDFLAHQATINRPGVVTCKESHIRIHLIPAFGKRRLDKIDTRSIDKFKIAKIEAGLAPATVNGLLFTLGRLMRVALKWKLLAEVPEISQVKQPEQGFDFLDFDEADAVLQAAAEYREHWHSYVLVALRTGLRVGEMVALRWREDIDLKRGRLRVQRSHSEKRSGFQLPKNGKKRELPLTQDALGALRAHRQRSSGMLVFPSAEGGVMTREMPRWALIQICRGAGIRSITNHVLRHSFASHAVMRGVPIRQVQEWMGHKEIEQTMRYSHLSEGIGDSLIQRLDPSSGLGP